MPFNRILFPISSHSPISPIFLLLLLIFFNFRSKMSALQDKGTVEREEGGEVFVVDNRNRDEIIKTILLVILIIVFPPAAIAIQANECNIHVCLSLGLMLFFVFPAYIHAIWYCFFKKTPENIIA